MTQAIVTPSMGRFHDVAEWLRELGDVPPERVLMNPWPGTATEADLLFRVERDTLCELIDGTLVEKPVGLLESFIAARLITYLNMFVIPRNLGYVSGEASTLKMKSGRVRLPDVAYISLADLPGGVLPKEPVPQIPPTIAVEVFSDGNTEKEMKNKRIEYFNSRSKLVWIIYPVTQTIEIFDRPSDEPARVLDVSGTLDGGDVLPGFTVKVADLFAGLPTNE